MPHRLRLPRVWAAACALAVCAVVALPARAGGAVQFGLRLAPGARIGITRTASHVISYDMNHLLLSMLGSRAAPTTVIDARTSVIDVRSADGHIEEEAVSTRRYGGDSPKDKSVVIRHDRYVGAIAASGVRTPAIDRLADAGDGALDQLPDTALDAGQSWTFSRPISIDRSLGEGTMTYTDTLTSVADRNGHRIAMISVKGSGVAQTASDLQAKGFHPSTYVLQGSAEFDLTAGMPGAQHYTAQVEWDARVMFARIGLKFADTYDASAWTVMASRK